MKNKLFLWLVAILISSTIKANDGPSGSSQVSQEPQPPIEWKRIEAREFADFSTYVNFASRKQGRNRKTIGIFVSSGQESYADICKNKAKIEAVQNLLQHSAPAQTELEFICYAHRNQKEAARHLADFIDYLSKRDQSKENLSFIFIAHGENPDVVNRASHQVSPKTQINALIYFQPTIYETYISPTGVKQNTDLLSRPKGFKRLYNLYAKTGELIVYNPIYSERKFRQQARLENDLLIMPVKNVRMLKIVNKQLEDYSNQDFFNIEALKNLPTLLEKLDQYQLNFDLLAIGFNQGISPLVVINRFLILNGSRVRAHYGIYPFEDYYDVTLNLPESVMNHLEQQFSTEFKRSQEALQTISQLPAAKGYGIMKQLNAEIDDIKRRHQKVAEGGIRAVEEEKSSPAQIAPPPPPRTVSVRSEQLIPVQTVTPPPAPAAPPKLPTPSREISKPGMGDLQASKGGLKKVVPQELVPSQGERWEQLAEQGKIRVLRNELIDLNEQRKEAKKTQDSLKIIRPDESREERNKKLITLKQITPRIKQLDVDINFIAKLLPKEEEWE